LLRNTGKSSLRQPQVNLLFGQTLALFGGAANYLYVDYLLVPLFSPIGPMIVADVLVINLNGHLELLEQAAASAPRGSDSISLKFSVPS
jgi:hypothetical protein